MLTMAKPYSTVTVSTDNVSVQQILCKMVFIKIGVYMGRGNYQKSDSSSLQASVARWGLVIGGRLIESRIGNVTR